MSKITLKKAEAELAELQKDFDSASARIKESGGPKGQLWIFNTKYKIYDLRTKIEDMKTGKIRTDKLTPEDLAIEKRIEGLENSLKNIEGGK